MKKSFFTLLLDHKTAANLFLILMIILGLYSSKILNTQFFPNYSIDYITINVEWPGASPKDIEESIIKPIEEKVRYIDKVKNTKSSAIDSFANILLEFRAGTNMQRALDDVDRAINSVNNLPEDAKDPDRKVIIPFEQIGLILIKSGLFEILSFKKTDALFRAWFLRFFGTASSKSNTKISAVVSIAFK